MYDCLLVDDEAPARKMLELMIDWKEIGFNKPDAASNGQKAYEMCKIKKYDVVFTDIQMPIMDGIEFISKVKEIYPRQKFIIVSCHESFAYAKKAIKLGVSDYIIKDIMTKEELSTLLIGMSNRAKLPRDEVVNEVENNMLQDYFLNGEIDLNELHNIIKYSKGKILVGYYIAISKNKNDSYIIKNYKNKLKSSYTAYAEIKSNHVFILKAEENVASKTQLLNQITTIANQIRALGYKHGVQSICIGISQIGKSDEVKPLYDTAKEASGMKMFFGINKNIFYDSIEAKIELFSQDTVKEKILDFKNNLKNNGDTYKSLSEIYVSGFSGIMKVNYFRYINDSIMGILLDYIRRENVEWEVLKGKGLELNSEQVANLETIQDMKEYFVTAIELVNEVSHVNLNSISERASRFIRKNVHKTISLSLIADELHFNKSYLSRMFKEETGKNIVQYIVDCKIEKAKEYLEDHQYKLSEISDLLSFSNQQYFSIIFKKEMGLSPIEYRKASQRV